MSIKIFQMTSRRTLSIVNAHDAGISRVLKIQDPKDVKIGLGFPLPDVFTAANGKADIATCIRASDGKKIFVIVPQGQRNAAETISCGFSHPIQQRPYTPMGGK